MKFFLSMMTVLSMFGLSFKLTTIELLDKKVAEYSKALLATNKLVLSGTGRGLRDGKIAIVGADYNTCKDVEIDEARMNIVKLTEFYLHKINSDPELQPLLLTRPFSVKNLELGIGYIKPNGSRSNPIGYSFTKEGSVFYSKYDPINDTLERVHQETYEEALAIVNGTNTDSQQ